MTTKEINETEFKKWGSEIWKIAETILKEGNESPEEKTKASEVISAFCVKIRAKSTFALQTFSTLLGEKFEKLLEEIRETKFNFPCEDGVKRKMTGEEWKEYLHQRIEDHHRTRVGKDIGDQDLPLIEQRIRKIDAFDKGKEEKQEQLLSEIYHTNKEDWNLIHGILDLRKTFFDITKRELFEVVGNIKEAIKKSPYFFENFSQILIKAQEAIEDQKEKPKEPEKKKEEKKSKIKTLEEEIKELERQNKDLEERLSDISLDQQQKALLEADLKKNKKRREATQARLDNLQRDLKSIDDDSKAKISLFLGIFAAVIAVICLIIVLVRRPSHRDY